MAEWTGRKRTLNSIDPVGHPPVDAASDHVPPSPEAPGASQSPQRPGATPDIADLPGRTRGDFDRLITTRRPLTEYGTAQHLLGLYTPAAGQQLTADDWELGPTSMQEQRKLNPENLTPPRPLRGYGLGIGHAVPAIGTAEAEIVEAIPTESADVAQPPTPQGIVTATVEAPPAPTGAVHGGGQVDCPPEFPIKGNAQSKIYHTPESRVYAQTIAEYCFATAEAAEAAGFRAPRN